MRQSSKRVLSGAALLSVLALLVSGAPAIAAAPAGPAAPAAPAVLPAPAAPAQGAVQPADDGANALPGLVQQPTNQCIEITVWAQDPETGLCYEFPNPCSVPQGWSVFFDPTTCENA